jgi:hypothetical protein
LQFQFLDETGEVFFDHGEVVAAHHATPRTRVNRC